MRPHEAMREYALMVLRFETLYKTVFENRLVRYFLRFIPSLQELVMLGKILYHLQEKRPDGRWRFDTVVLDAPATGHAISFLNVPQVLLADGAARAPWPARRMKMRDLLVDPSVTAAVLVALPEEMPVNETLELHAALRDTVHIRTHAAVLNGGLPASASPRRIWRRWRATRSCSELAKAHHDRAGAGGAVRDEAGAQPPRAGARGAAALRARVRARAPSSR